MSAKSRPCARHEAGTIHVGPHQWFGAGEVPGAGGGVGIAVSEWHCPGLSREQAGEPPGRVVERLDDFRPLLARTGDGSLMPAHMAALAGTELINCGVGGDRCTRAFLATGPLDLELTMELVDDEGWSFEQPFHYCPEHRGAGSS